MISQLVAAIRHIDPEITDRDIADTLWLALQIRKAVGTPQLDRDETLSEAASKIEPKDKINLPPKSSTSKLLESTPIPESTKSGVYPSSVQGRSGEKQSSGLPFRSPARQPYQSHFILLGYYVHSGGVYTSAGRLCLMKRLRQGV